MNAPYSNPDSVTPPADGADEKALAVMFKALGDPTRLRMFRFLRNCCCPVAVDETTGEVRPVEGPTVGEVCCHITGERQITSTLSEHLKDLRIAGVIVMERRGKTTICAAHPEAVAKMASVFQDAPEKSEGVANDDCYSRSCCP